MQHGKLIFEGIVGSVEDLHKTLEIFFENHIKNERGAVLLLQGSLGSGKTTICKLLGKILQLPFEINSPTFTIYNHYLHNNISFFHYDLYRLSPVEIEELELRDLWYDVYDNLFTIHAIEWWEKANSIDTKLKKFFFVIEILDANRRKLQIHE